MDLALDRKKRKVTGDAVSLSDTVVASLKLGHEEEIRVELFDDGAKAELASGESIVLVLKPEGQFEAPALQVATLTPADYKLGRYEKIFSTQTDEARALLGIDDDSTNDVPVKRIVGALVFLRVGGEPREADEFFINLRNAVYQDGDTQVDGVEGPEAALTARAVRHDIEQDIDLEGQARARANIDAASTADITSLESDLATKADLVSGKVPASQLPAYVDDVVEAANFAALPVTGETGKIYVTTNDNKSFRWSGTVYVEMTSSPTIATQSQAEAGTDNAAMMTSLRTAQAIAKNSDLQTAYLGGLGAQDATAVLGNPSKPFASIQGLLFNASVIAFMAGGGGTNRLQIVIRPKATGYGNINLSNGVTNAATVGAFLERVSFVGCDKELCYIDAVTAEGQNFAFVVKLRGNGLVKLGNSLEAGVISGNGYDGNNGVGPTWSDFEISDSTVFPHNPLSFIGYENGYPAWDGSGMHLAYNGEGSYVLTDGGNFVYWNSTTLPSEGVPNDWSGDTITHNGAQPSGGSGGTDGTNATTFDISGFRVVGIPTSLNGIGGEQGDYYNNTYGLNGQLGGFFWRDCELECPAIYTHTRTSMAVGGNDGGSQFFYGCRGRVGTVNVSAENPTSSGTPGQLLLENCAGLSIAKVEQKHGGGSDEVSIGIVGTNGFVGNPTSVSMTFYFAGIALEGSDMATVVSPEGGSPVIKYAQNV